MKLTYILISVFFFSASKTNAHQTEINIINFADIYNLNKSEYGSGLKSLKKLLDKQKSVSNNLIICCSGDVLVTNGNEKKLKGKKIVELLNECKINFSSFGNHEFAFGIEELENRITESNFHWIGSNIRKITNKPNISGAKLNNSKDYSILNIDNIKIGFFSICLPETKVLYKKECKNINFLDPYEVAEYYLNIFDKQKVDIVVALTHQDLKDDILLAKKFPQIKIILGAHDHENISIFNGKTLIHKAGSDAGFIGRINIKLNKEKNESFLSWETINNNFNIIENNDTN